MTLTRKEVARLGGLAIAKINREKAVIQYYKDPSYCQHCGKILEVKENDKVCHVKSRKFCDRSCAAKHNNLGKDRHQKHRIDKSYEGSKYTKNEFEPCLMCGIPVQQTAKKTNGSRLFWKKFYCDNCLPKIRSQNGATRHNGRTREDYENTTKGELVKEKNSYFLFKNKIGMHARKVFNESGQPNICEICGYSVYTEICHKKDVKDFPDNATVMEINHISNLVCLCPNHHVEFDLGLIKL